MAGPTSSGWVAKTVADLVADLNASWRSVFGAIVNVDPSSRNGQEIGILSGALSEVWNLAEAVAGAFDPTGAGGVLLDNLCALTGTKRKAATASKLTGVILVGTDATAVTAGHLVSVPGTSFLFATDSDQPIRAISSPAWVTGTPYSAGALVRSGGKVWYTYAGGTSGATAPTGTAATFLDGVGGVLWVNLGTGGGAAIVNCTCTTTGPNPAYAGTLTNIVTPVSGWAGVWNPTDAVLGTKLELDPALRLRRKQEIAGIGSAQLDAVRAKIAKIDGVVFVTAFQNNTDTPVGGMPGHSVEYLVEGGADAAIAQVLFDNVAGGIETTGNTTSTAATDSLGHSWSESWSRPDDLDVWVKVFLIVDPGAYPINGDDQVKVALAGFGNGQGLGRDVVPSVLQAALFPIYDASNRLVSGVPGVLDVYSATLVGLSNPPTSAVAIALTVRQRGIYDTSRIVVATQAGTP